MNFTKRIGDKQIVYPVELELMYQYFEKETGLDRKDICSKLEIQTPEEKYPLMDIPEYKANF